MKRASIIRRNIVNLVKYQMSIIVIQLIMFMLTIMLNYSIGLIVSAVSSSPEAGGGSLDTVAIIYGLVLGALFFSVSFKFSLINGLSRRTLLISCVFTLLIGSAALSLLGGILMCTPSAGNTFNLYFSLYGKNYLGLFPWLFSAMLMMQTLGWLISVFFVRASKKAKLVTLGAFLMLVPIFLLLNLIKNGALGRGLIIVLKFIVGISGSGISPYTSIGALLLISVLLFCGILLMLRRASLKN